MKVFHGTTEKGLNAIRNGGGKPNSPWNCSDNDGVMYVWPLDKVIECHDLEDMDQSEQSERGIIQGFESAEIQAVIEGSETVYVIECEIPGNLLDDDFSCDNMNDIASCLLQGDFKPEFIERVYKFDLNKWGFPFVVARFLNNPYFNQYAIDEKLLEVARTLAHCDSEPTEFYDYSEIIL